MTATRCRIRGNQNMTKLNEDQLFSTWLRNYSDSLPMEKGILRVRRAEPRFQTRNYFARYKVETAVLDGTGQNPTGVTCVVVEASATDQTAAQAPQTACDSIKDL